MSRQKMDCLATITITVENRKAQAQELNIKLSENGDIIINRLGFHVGMVLPSFFLSGYIVLIANSTKEIIEHFVKELNQLSGITAQAIFYPTE